ncbi:MAG: hypothetical protein O8C62_05805 [Candidatus Methanoperedens sp.]|nr:hypothetical protein [Candidatus Methanoperedens sp.]
MQIDPICGMQVDENRKNPGGSSGNYQYFYKELEVHEWKAIQITQI